MSQVVGTDTVLRMMARVQEGARGKLMELMPRIGFDLAKYVQDAKLSGRVLNRRTGRLRRSINSQTRDAGTAISAIVGTNVQYARPLEEGSKPHEIVPVRKKMLSFMVGGRRVFARKVNHPGTRAYRFLASSLQETAPANIARIRQTMRDLITESQA